MGFKDVVNHKSGCCESMPTTLPRNCDISKALLSLEKMPCLYYIYGKCDNSVILL